MYARHPTTAEILSKFSWRMFDEFLARYYKIVHALTWTVQQHKHIGVLFVDITRI